MKSIQTPITDFTSQASHCRSTCIDGLRQSQTQLVPLEQPIFSNKQFKQPKGVVFSTTSVAVCDSFDSISNDDEETKLNNTQEKQPTIITKQMKQKPIRSLKKEQSYNSKLKDFPPRFSFEGQTRYIDKFLFYDSDTFCGVMTLENKQFTFVFRCLGYDSIEKKIPQKDLQTISEDDQKFLKQIYKKSYDLLSSLIEGKQLKIECGKSDLYQRILANIFVKSDPNSDQYDICINQEMLKSKLVFPYTSDNLTKKTLKEQVAFLKEFHTYQ